MHVPDHGKDSGMEHQRIAKSVDALGLYGFALCWKQEVQIWSLDDFDPLRFWFPIVTSVLFGWVAIPSAHVFESAILFRDGRKNYETCLESYDLSRSSYKISKSADSGPKWDRKIVKCTYGWLIVVNIP